MCIGAILAIALLLRFWHIDYGFVSWQDTGFVAGFAKAMAVAGPEKVGFLALRWYDIHTGEFSYYVNHPFLTHISLAALFQIFGPQEWVYRSFNLLVGGVLGGVFLYRLAHERLGSNVALGALLLWAIVPSTAYFERMFSMSMQALTFSIILTFFFLRNEGPPRGLNQVGLYLAAFLGPLFDWQFSFIFVPLLIYALFDRARLPVLIAAGTVSSIVTLVYMIYSAGVVAGAGSLSGFFDAALIRWTSYISGKVEVDKSIFDFWGYLGVLGRRFDLHFTKLGVFLVGLWAAVIALRAYRRKLNRWEFVIPAILLAPAVIYFVLVPHNTLGHIWTLYFIWPVMAVMFGTVFATALEVRPRACGVGLATGLAVILVGGSLPIVSALHGFSPYHLANTRVGQILDLQRDSIRSYAVENQDTVMFYTNVRPMEFNGRKNIGKWLAARQARKQPLPHAIAFNQGYRQLIPADSAGRFANLDEVYARQMAPFGYRAALLRPVPLWSRVTLDDLFLVMDQYPVFADAVATRPAQPQVATFMSGGHVLRGIYHAHENQDLFETRFRDVGVPVGVDALRMSVLLRGQAPGAKFEIELAAADGTRVTRSGVLNKNSTRHLDIPARKFRGKVATLKVRSTLTAGQGLGHVYVAEPRLQSAAMDSNNSLVVKPGAAIYHNERFTDPESRLGFDAAVEFWGKLVRRVLK